VILVTNFNEKGSHYYEQHGERVSSLTFVDLHRSQTRSHSFRTSNQR